MINYDKLFYPLFEKSYGMEVIILYTGLFILAKNML